MKLLVQRAGFLLVVLIVLALAVQTVVTAQPSADSQVYLPIVSYWPTPTPTPTPTVRPIFTMGPFGGSGGDFFQDSVPDPSYVTGVIIHSGFVVDNLQMVLNTGALGAHGGDGGVQQQLNLASDEYITEIDGSYGVPNISGWTATEITQITIRTNHGTYGPYGDGGGTLFAMAAPAGNEIVGFFGHAGIFVDQLGVLYRVHR